MVISEINIHNFRGIIEQSFKLYNYSLLIGANNSGKTTVIDAIRIFYENCKFDKDKDFPFNGSQDEESWIDITFSLSNEEYDSLANDYKLSNNRLKIRKYLKTEDKNKNGYFFGYDKNNILMDNPFYGAKNVGVDKLGDVIYIPATSKVEEHTKLGGSSVLKDLLTNILQDVVENSDSFSKLQNEFGIFSNNIKQETSSNGYSLAGVETDLNSLIGDWGATFSLNISSPSINEIIKSMTDFNFFDKVHNRPQNVDQFGSGFQRHFIYSLIQTGAKYVIKKTNKVKKDFSPQMTLILFEEPEAFLHPNQQEFLSKSLIKLSNNSDWQVLCSTHSQSFVSKSTQHIPSLIKLKRNSDGLIFISQIDDNLLKEIIDSNQTLNSIAKKHPELAKNLSDDDSKPEMEVIKYAMWLNSERCCMFFSDRVLLVEGQTEKSLITKLIDDEKICIGNKSLFILDCLGKFNIHRFMNIMSNLGIDHYVLYDNDKNEKFHKDLNQLIEDSKTKFSIKTKEIDGDIEDFLYVQKPKRSDQKPQHILFQYDSGNISEEKIEEFCKLIEELIR
jgi:predicted ATP-dependent endonuclease of OLD family